MKKTNKGLLAGYLWKNISPLFIPSYRRIRKSFIGLLLFIALDLATRDWHQVSVNVSPVEQTAGLVKTYLNTSSLKAGTLVISDPSPIILLFSQQNGGRVSVFTLLMVAIASAIIILMSPKLSDEYLFRKDISRSIQWIGVLVLLHWGIAVLGIAGVDDVVKSLTNAEYTSAHDFNLMVFAEAYIGLMIIAAGRWYRQGVNMRQEQDLTI